VRQVGYLQELPSYSFSCDVRWQCQGNNESAAAICVLINGITADCAGIGSSIGKSCISKPQIVSFYGIIMHFLNSSVILPQKKFW